MGMSHNINKALTETNWLSEWQPEYTLNVNIFNKKIFCMQLKNCESYIPELSANTNKTIHVTDWPSEWQTEIHQTWTYLSNNISVFHKIFCKNICSRCIRQNLNKVIPVTDWPSEWQTENTLNMNIFNIQIFCLV